VVTQDAAGRVNAAPFSFFNVMGSAPPTVALGMLADPQRGVKDSARNILDTGEFVVNLVPERLVVAMNVTAVDAPRGVDELALAGLATTPSTHIAPPRISESPVAFECRTHTLVETGPAQIVVIGQVIAVHIDDRFILDAERAHIDTPALDLVARSYGSDYVRSHDTFQLQRPTWAER
jgi:flavin reductase (DIM6/NTAB) family NADH-FMN oxidoreductase RutF